MTYPRIDLPRDQIADFCRRWKFTEFSLFGSILRDDFRPDSDIDALVSFAPDARWSLFDFFGMEEELEALLGRKVDMMTRSAVEQSYNWIRRKEILRTTTPYHVE